MFDVCSWIYTAPASGLTCIGHAVLEPFSASGLAPNISWTCHFGTLFCFRVGAQDIVDMPCWNFPSASGLATNIS